MDVARIMSGYLTVDNFLESSLRNSWTDQDGVRVYVRRGNRTLRSSPEILKVFDIAHIISTFPGQGFFTRWLDDVTKKVRDSGEFSGIYVENIGEDRFFEFFKKRGYFNSGKVGDERSLYFMFEGTRYANNHERSPS